MMAAKHRRSGDEERLTKHKKNASHKDNTTSKHTRQEEDRPPSVIAILVCAICAGVIHSVHVATMFENDRHFSHLSNLEREMTFRTEMGLYYSYYKTLVEADSFLLGLNRLMHDNLTEFPDTINTLQRFNLYPEVVLGGTYRVFQAVNGWLGLETRWCWQLCVMASLLAARRYWRIIERREIHVAILAVLVSGMCVRGFRNISEQRGIVGEYSNPELEELIDWVRTETGDEAVFAGPMSTMANLLLSTRRPIVNHPHYEHSGLRERTKRVYSVFSRRSAESVYETLLAMKVNYVVLEESWCVRKSRAGCGMVDIWDAEEPHNRHKPALCPRLFHRSPAPFDRVFANNVFVVLQVPSRYVEIPPPRYHSA